MAIINVTNTKNEIEKQYEANYQIRKDIATFIFNYRGDIKDRAKWMDYLGFKVSFVEKQGEQKPADKIGPKFHEGDWVVSVVNGNIYHVINVEDLLYIMEHEDERCTFHWKGNDDVLRAWNITKDAKDVDVLCYENEISLYKHDIKTCNNEGMTFGGFVYHCCYDGKRFIMDSLYSITEQDKIDIHPATKEQRDTLMKAMADAGWEFDFEKKEMKKIEQNPAWSKEDEEMLNKVIEDIVKLAGPYVCYHKDVDWLKSLKDRVQLQWKPSDEQIEALGFAADCIVPAEFCFKRKELKGLLEQLKKLREE